VAQSEENGGAVAPPVDCPVNHSYSSGSSLFFGVVLAFRLFFDHASTGLNRPKSSAT